MEKLSETYKIHSDPPTIEHPSINYVLAILYNIQTNIENEDVPIEKFIELIATELEKTKSIFWFYEKKFFIDLAFSIEEFLITHKDAIKQKTKSDLIECITLLRFISKKQINLENLPIGYEKDDLRIFTVRARIWLRVKDKFSSPNIKCPSCNNEFSQVAFDVTRTMYAVKCPKCKQSVVLSWSSELLGLSWLLINS